MIRCLVADDSRAFRAILRAILENGPEIEVVGEAADGAEAVAKVLSLRPDVVTMDVRMPGKDGLAAIDEIMRLAPTPVVVVSAEAGPERQEVSFRALDLGAVEVLAKPRADAPGRFERDADAIRMAVRAVAGLRLVTRRPRRPGALQAAAPPHLAAIDALPGLGGRAPFPALVRAPVRAGSAPRVLGIVASTGGPAALARIFQALPAGFPIPVLVVQHIGHGFSAGLVHWLAGETKLDVRLALDGAPLLPGTVYVAAEGRHLGLTRGRLHLSDDPPVHGFRPSGSVLLAELARELGAAAAGLVLSGMGEDGADGLLALRARGGWTAAQGPRSSVVYGMPRVARERGAAGESLELDDIPAALLRLARVREGA